MKHRTENEQYTQQPQTAQRTIRPRKSVKYRIGKFTGLTTKKAKGNWLT